MHHCQVLLLLPCLLLLHSASAQWGPFVEPCRSNQYPPPTNTALQWYTIDLDTPPEQRWLPIIANYIPQYWDLIEFSRTLVPLLDPVRKEIISLFDTFAAKLLPRFPSELALEIASIAHATGVPLGEVLISQISYDLHAQCTSIVSQTNNTNEVIHARNLDFGRFLGWDAQNHTFRMTELLRALAVNVDFRRGNITVFQAVQFVGTVGVFTGVAPRRLSLSSNTRRVGDWWDGGGLAGMLQWLLNDNDASQFVALLSRQVLENPSMDFAAAKTALATTPLVAPVYFIIASGSSSEGCVLSRGQTDSLNERCIDANNWWVLETNFDWWQQPPPWNNRRASAVRCMNEMQTPQNVSAAGMFNVLSTKPVRNLGTVFTAIMRPASDGGSGGVWLESYLQYCLEDNCWPF